MIQNIDCDNEDKLKDIRLLLLDVDGVLTDGGIIYDGHGIETKMFNVRDGHGIKMLQRAGIQVGIITGRRSPVVDIRARELGIVIVYQGALRKLESYDEIKAITGLGDSQIAYMGDDLIDIPVLRRAGFSAAPHDAHPDVIGVVSYVSSIGGGRGAVRELCELILKCQDKWHDVADRYEL